MKQVSLIIIFLSLSLHAMHAQFNLSTSGSLQLIEDAVKSGLLVIRQYYRLQDTTSVAPAYFGRNDAPYFGVTYSLGVKTETGYLADDRAVRPWIYDTNFEEYRESRQYAPVISQTGYRELDSISYLPLPFRDRPIDRIAGSRLYSVRDSVSLNRGFTADSLSGLKKGWLVWAVSDKPMLGQDTIPVSFLLYPSELTFTDGQATYEVKTPSTYKSILGGIYILPEVTAAGRITFLLSGMLQYENDQWQVVRINHVNETGLKPASGNRLTPVPTSTKKTK